MFGFAMHSGVVKVMGWTMRIRKTSFIQLIVGSTLKHYTPIPRREFLEKLAIDLIDYRL